jgi:hypothetical protein
LLMLWMGIGMIFQIFFTWFYLVCNSCCMMASLFPNQVPTSSHLLTRRVGSTHSNWIIRMLWKGCCLSWGRSWKRIVRVDRMDGGGEYHRSTPKSAVRVLGVSLCGQIFY